MIKIAVACDHRGADHKNKFVKYLKRHKYEVIDLGCKKGEKVDYPEYGFALGHAVVDQSCLGIGICGSGIGITIAVNKIKEARAFNCCFREQAVLAKQHNNCNVICFGADFLPFKECKKMFKKFIKTKYEGGRHEARVKMLDEGDKKNEG